MMWRAELIINIITIGLITIVLGCLLGLAITRVIDRRLAQISINLPKIVVPQPAVFEDFESEQKNKVSDMSQDEVKIGCNSDKDCNVVYGNGQNKCRIDHTCDCVKGSGQFCHYGPTYYKDPKDMTPQELRQFKLNAKVYKMTLQDYKNWLIQFEDQSEQDLLAPQHFANLQKLLKGLPLTDDDVPREDVPPPLTAEQYFDQLYQLDAQLNPRNAETAGLQLPANYLEYSQYDNPRNLKHLDDRDQLESLHKYQKRETLDQTQWKISHDYRN